MITVSSWIRGRRSLPGRDGASTAASRINRRPRFAGRTPRWCQRAPTFRWPSPGSGDAFWAAGPLWLDRHRWRASWAAFSTPLCRRYAGVAPRMNTRPCPSHSRQIRAIPTVCPMCGELLKPRHRWRVDDMILAFHFDSALGLLRQIRPSWRPGSVPQPQASPAI